MMRLALAMALWFLGLAAWGATTNVGTGTFANGLAGAAAGDTLVLSNGTYSYFSVTTSNLTIQAQNKWGAVVSGGAPPVAIGYNADAPGVTIDGLAITASHNTGVNIYASNAIIQNCWIYDNATMGVESHHTRGNTIQRCLIEGNGTTATQDHGIYVSGTNWVVRCNVVRSNLAWGIQFYESGGEAVNCQVYGNLVYHNGTEGTNSDVDGIVMYGTSGAYNYVYGNTVICTVGDALQFQNSTFCVTNNYFSGGTFGDAGSSTWLTGHNYTNGSPAFVDTSKALYWLTSGSPLRSGADSAVVPALDFWGNTGSAPSDIGFAQYSATYAADTRNLSGAGSDFWSELNGAGPTISVGTLQLFK